MTERERAPHRPQLERIRGAMTAGAQHVAPLVIALDGLVVAALGVISFAAAAAATQGESLVLLLAGMAFISLGAMMIVRWNLRAVRTGLAGLTAGYFAITLTEFEVRTDPCDIGATMAACAGHVVTDTPWGVYQGPAILAAVLFVFLALEPFTPEGSSAP